MRMIKIVLSLARAAMRLSATTRRAAAVLALAMFSGLAINAQDYYLLGNYNGWQSSNDCKMQTNPDAPNEYIINKYLEKSVVEDNNQGIKVWSSSNIWYPSGGNYKIPETGNYTVYFVPKDNNQGDVYVENNDYYLVGSMNDWTANSQYRLCLNRENTSEYYVDLTLTSSADIKVVRSLDVSNKDGYVYFPGGNNYYIEQAGTYRIYFQPNGNSNWGDTYYFTALRTGDVDVSVNIAKEGYGTYYNSHNGVALPIGKDVKAYIVTDVNGGTLTYNLIADNDNTTEQPNTVPAGTAILLKVATTDITNGKIDLTLKSKDTDNRTITGNKLYGSDEDLTPYNNTSLNYYMLSYDSNGANIGWYFGNANGRPFENKAHKAWLELSTTALSRSFFDLPDTGEKTGISTTRIETNDNWYSIDGRRLNGKPLQRGVYINNGKKLIIK